MYVSINSKCSQFQLTSSVEYMETASGLVLPDGNKDITTLKTDGKVTSKMAAFSIDDASKGNGFLFNLVKADITIPGTSVCQDFTRERSDPCEL